VHLILWWRVIACAIWFCSPCFRCVLHTEQPHWLIRCQHRAGSLHECKQVTWSLFSSCPHCLHGMAQCSRLGLPVYSPATVAVRAPATSCGRCAASRAATLLRGQGGPALPAQELRTRVPVLCRWHSPTEVLMEPQQAAMWQAGLAPVYRPVLTTLLEAAVLAVLLILLPLPSLLAVLPHAPLAVHHLGRRHRSGSLPDPVHRRRRLYHPFSSDLAVGQHVAHAGTVFAVRHLRWPPAVLHCTCFTSNPSATSPASGDSRSWSVAVRIVQSFALQC
jgi:hypothetical protein